MKSFQKVITVLLAVCLLAGIAVFAGAEAKTTVNGDAEKGDLTGWKTYADLNSGMSLANIADPDNVGNRVIKFTPATSGGLTDWSIPMFNIGADVFRDTENGFNGGGAGTYKISMKVKTSVAGTQYAHVSLRTGAWNWSDDTYNRIGYNKDAWIRLNEGVTNDADATIQYDATSKWNTVTKTFTVTSAFINAKKAEFDDGNAWAYELYVSIDNPNIVYYIDDVKVIESPEKPQAKTVINGDAELGTTEGWNKLFGNGTLTNEKLDGSNVIHFVPKADDVYSSVMFDFGPAIVNDPSNGYNGAGAGKYTVSFRVKGDDSATGDGAFNVSMISNAWNKMTAKPTESRKYITVSKNEWTKYTFTFDITADMLAALDSKDAYMLSLRFDGSGSSYAYGQGNWMGYYIDDMKIFAGDAPAEEEQGGEQGGEQSGEKQVTAMQTVNGNAELKTLEGWSGLFNNGTLTNEKIDGSNVIHFVPKANDYYSSVVFDLGASIVNDPANGYNGGGAKEYTVSFRIKSDDKNKSGAFTLSLVSYSGAAWDKFKAYSQEKTAVKVTPDWTEYTYTFDITNEMLDAIKGNKDAYKIGIRLDGSGKVLDHQYVDGGNWLGYYIDDVKISYDGMPKDTGDALCVPALAVLITSCVAVAVVAVFKKKEQL